MRFLLISLLLVAVQAMAQPSPFNGLQPVPPDSSGAYRLIVGGHFHGSSNSLSGFPAASLLANLDTFNKLGANMLLSTGDLFLHADKDRLRFERTLFEGLTMPLYNAPGNHDVEDGTYVDRYGPTHGSIDMGGDRIVLLDTERDNGNIRGEQLELLAAQVDAGLQRLFIISHRPVWAEDDAIYSPLFEGNTRSLLSTNFRKEVFPILERIAQRTEVFWVGGSMAGKAPSSIFFQPHADNITYIQSAIRDVPRDAVLIADVDRERVRWSVLSLTGEEFPAAEEMNAEWWAANMSTEVVEFNWRLLPYLTGKIVTHRAFWWGAGSMLLLLLLLRWILRKRN